MIKSRRNEQPWLDELSAMARRQLWNGVVPDIVVRQSIENTWHVDLDQS